VIDTRTALGFLYRAALTSLVASSVVVLLFLGILPRTGAYKTMTVLSGSMRPDFAPGDMVIAEPKPAASLKIGDVLVYSIPIGDHHVESHRVIKVVSRDPLTVVTKGDANKEADPWTAQLDGERVWTVRRSVPYAGLAILWLRSPQVHRVTTLFIPALVAVLILRGIWRRKDDDPLPDVNVPSRI
jgi:signal peptidase I